MHYVFIYTICLCKQAGLIYLKYIGKGPVQYNIKPGNQPTLGSSFTFHKQTCMVYFGSLFRP